MNVASAFLGFGDIGIQCGRVAERLGQVSCIARIDFPGHSPEKGRPSSLRSEEACGSQKNCHFAVGFQGSLVCRRSPLRSLFF